MKLGRGREVDDIKWGQAMMFSENARRQIARAYAVHFCEEVLPLISSLPERERTSAIAFETERMLKSYDEYLANACDRFQQIANDAISCSLKPLLITDPKGLRTGVEER